MAASPSLRRVNQTLPGTRSALPQPTWQAQAPPRPPAAAPPPSPVETLMREAADGADASGRLDQLRRLILTDGVENDRLGSGMCSYRVYVWLVLLRARVMPYEEYAALLKRGPSPSYAKISDDTHRTLATDPLFARRVSQNSIARLLNTVAWRLSDDLAVKRSKEDSDKQNAAVEGVLSAGEKTDGAATGLAEQSAQPGQSTQIAGTGQPAPLPDSSTVSSTAPAVSESTVATPQPQIPAASNPPTSTAQTTSTTTTTATQPAPAQLSPTAPSTTPSGILSRPPKPSTTYLQGMNVLAAPLLYASRSEPQSHILLHTLLTTQIPSYISPTMSGVHSGLSLLDRLLSLLDPSLHAHLSSKNITPSVWAFPSVLTLSACTPPLPEVLQLWDFLFAWGVHLNLLAVVAQVHLMRGRLIGSEAPGKELRSLGPLRAKAVIDLVVAFVGRVPAELWAEVERHCGGVGMGS